MSEANHESELKLDVHPNVQEVEEEDCCFNSFSKIFVVTVRK
jgi:hypothetical protein